MTFRMISRASSTKIRTVHPVSSAVGMGGMVVNRLPGSDPIRWVTYPTVQSAMDQPPEARASASSSWYPPWRESSATFVVVKNGVQVCAQPWPLEPGDPVISVRQTGSDIKVIAEALLRPTATRQCKASKLFNSPSDDDDKSLEITRMLRGSHLLRRRYPGLAHARALSSRASRAGHKTAVWCASFASGASKGASSCP